MDKSILTGHNIKKLTGCFSLATGVRLDRVRGGRQKYKRSPDNSPVLYYHGTSSAAFKRFCAEGKSTGQYQCITIFAIGLGHNGDSCR